MTKDDIWRVLLKKRKTVRKNTIQKIIVKKIISM